MFTYGVPIGDGQIVLKAGLQEGGHVGVGVRSKGIGHIGGHPGKQGGIPKATSWQHDLIEKQSQGTGAAEPHQVVGDHNGFSGRIDGEIAHAVGGNGCDVRAAGWSRRSRD